MLCYIEADRYGNNLALLEEAVTTFTYFPLNEICAGFFFGAFNIMAAIEDMAGLQSLYVKTQVLKMKWCRLRLDWVGFLAC